MAPVTPPRPIDIVEHFPELAPLAATAVRLHPRPGEPTAADSSIGGPLLWPAGDPWPSCAEHRGTTLHGASVPDLLQARRIRALARAADTDPRTPPERAFTDRVDAGVDVEPAEPIPMLPVAQLYAQDVPGLPRPDGADLLQVLWCPFDHEDQGYLPTTVLRWRIAAEVTDPLTTPPQPEIVDNSYLPQPCVLHPEEVTEYPLGLPEELEHRIRAWEERTGLEYQYDLSVAPGCKFGGHAPWSATDPFPMHCPDCGADVTPLLNLDTFEGDGGTQSWQPVESGTTDPAEARVSDSPTELMIGRAESMQFYVCTNNPTHRHITNLQ